jgi:hypothetical protein
MPVRKKGDARFDFQVWLAAGADLKMLLKSLPEDLALLQKAGLSSLIIRKPSASLCWDGVTSVSVLVEERVLTCT